MMILKKSFIALLLFLVPIGMSGQQDGILDELSFLNEKPSSSGLVVLKFFATWCVPCIHEIPDYNELVKTVGDSIGFLTISNEKDHSKVKQVLAKHNVKGSWAIDTSSRVYSRFGIKHLPDYIMINSSGSEVFHGSLKELTALLLLGQISKEKWSNQPLNEVAELEVLGTRPPMPFGESSFERKGASIKAEFKNYSVASLLGVQLFGYSLATTLIDTTDFQVNLKIDYVLNDLENEKPFDRLIEWLPAKLNCNVDTVVKQTEVWMLKEVPKNMNIKANGGWFLGTKHFEFNGAYASQLKFALENNWGIIILIPDSLKDVQLVFKVRNKSDWDSLRKEMAKKGFRFEKRIESVNFLRLKFNTESGDFKPVFSQFE